MASTFLISLAEYLLLCFQNWFWLILVFTSGFFLFRIVSAFLAVKPRRGWRIALVLFLGSISDMVIWLGDTNLLFVLLFFFPVLLLASKGDRAGRLTLTVIFFCLIMSVNAVLDTYYGPIMARFDLDDLYYYSNKFIRLAVWAMLYLAPRKHLPKRPPQLSPRFWRLVLLLAAMPFSSLLAVVLLPFLQSDYIYENGLLHSLTMNIGVAVLPFVFLTSLVLLYAIQVLEEHQRLEEADKLASLRESYYQNLRREEQQVRTLRHDMRNHLTAVQGLLERGETQRAASYLSEIASSPAMGGRRNLCENETANVVLAAKAEDMDQRGLIGDFAVSLPRELSITDTDLCALLGNALDNAIEAAVQAGDKRISVRCRADKGLFMLRVENAVEGEIRPDLSTTKADKSAHGFGLAGMREIAQRCGGSLETRVQGGRFELVACIPLESA
jgi:sensor histidine kinase YesM